MPAAASPPALPAALDFPRIKLLAVGDVGVGKSCVIKRYCEGRFVVKYIPTIGIDFGVKRVDVNKVAVLQQKQQLSSSTASSTNNSSIPAAVRVNFWDGSGDDDYHEVRNEFYDAAQGILIFYDVRNAQSFAHLDNWWEELTTYCEGLAESTKSGTEGGPAGGGKRASLTPATVTSGTAAGKAVGHNGGKAPIVVLCANKVDDTVDGGAGASRATRVVSEEQGRAWATAHGCAGYYETSASTEKNVKEAIEDLVTQVVVKFM
jgi:DnaJ homolog subfamily C member 27